MHPKTKTDVEKISLRATENNEEAYWKKDCKEKDQAHITFNRELPTIEQLTQLLMTEAMKRANNNKSIAAEMLGMSL